MKVAIAILILSLLPSFGNAADKWDRTDKILVGTYLLATGIDWRQTVHIAHNPDKYNELNSFCGRPHPSEADVNHYFIVSVAAKLLIAHFLPSKWRKVWLGGMIAISGTLVTYNFSHGIRLEW